MIIPKICNSINLAALASAAPAPAETIKIRVILPGKPGKTPVHLTGSHRKYSFTHSAALAAHVLDVPLSVWNYGIPKGITSGAVNAGVLTGAYTKSNASIASDINALNKGNLFVTALVWS
ncbi:MAG: hypothetical protein WCO57_04670 [Verrucomicrobiota bacterium]